MERFAPENAIWVCAACGKTHKDRYGMEGQGSPGWDESCALNSFLCHETKQVGPTGLVQWAAYESAPEPSTTP